MFDFLDESFIRELEKQLPILSVKEKEIIFNSSPELVKGIINIENIGKGELLGELFSESPNIIFNAPNWKGNTYAAEYSIILNNYMYMDSFESEIIIESNGGIEIIPVSISIEPPYIEDDKGKKIRTLIEFVLYAQNNVLSAVKLFKSDKFSKWLNDINSEHQLIYKHLVTQGNKYKAMDEFFQLCGLKEKAVIKVEESVIEEEITSLNEIIEKKINIKKIIWGYINVSVALKNNSPFIKLSKSILSDEDFSSDGNCSYSFSINTYKADKNFLKEEIVFTDANKTNIQTVLIMIKKTPFIVARTSKESYSLEDKGVLIVENNAEKDITIDVYVKDSYIKFSGNSYFVSKMIEIPFEIRFPIFSSVNLGFNKKPFYESEILIKTVIDSIPIHKRVKVIAGSVI